MLYTAHLQCYFLQCNCLQCSLARAYSIHTQALVTGRVVVAFRRFSRHSRASVSLSTQQASFTFKLVFQELPRLVDLVSWWQQSVRVGFLIALHHRGSISQDVTDVPCMLSPSRLLIVSVVQGYRQELEFVHRLCQRSKIPVPRVAQASGVDS